MGRIRPSSIRQTIGDFKRTSSTRINEDPYSRFDLLDGTHPWQSVVEKGFILYPVRMLNEGKVAYFNFDLAKEMGLIDLKHPHSLTKKLERKLLETFSVRIINEYDEANNIRFHPSVMKSKKYMATRYLQLQHPNKTGTTSGDGRCIWNGCVDFNGVLWDVSSRGTGVTALAPGAVEAGKPLKSGNTDFGYGCGLADIDELLAASITAEIFHRNGVSTERVLCVIDLGKGYGIGVRAGKNLLRPAHLFNHLKQGNFEALKRATDYLIERQFKNGEWGFHTSTSKRYDLLLEEVCETFAQFAAQLDRDYIFAWLDWDGDNVLANGGIIDYGSIRQMGLRHDQYRYDDISRYSTNLNEQTQKARQLVQVYSQLVDFLKTGTKKPVQSFSSHPILKKFDQHFEYYQLDFFLQQIGLDRKHRVKLLTSEKKLIQSVFESYFTLETTKTLRRTMKVADGINRPAIFNMRLGLVALAKHYSSLKSVAQSKMTADQFFNLILASTARGRDRRMSTRQKVQIELFLGHFNELILNFTNPSQRPAIARRAFETNRPDRMTGDGLLHLVDKLLAVWRHGRGEPHLLQKTIDSIVTEQSRPLNTNDNKHTRRLQTSRRIVELTRTLLSLVDGHKESI